MHTCVYKTSDIQAFFQKCEELNIKPKDLIFYTHKSPHIFQFSANDIFTDDTFKDTAVVRSKDIDGIIKRDDFHDLQGSFGYFVMQYQLKKANPELSWSMQDIEKQQTFSTGGFELKLDSLWVLDNEMICIVKQSKPAPSDMCTMAITTTGFSFSLEIPELPIVYKTISTLDDRDSLLKSLKDEGGQCLFALCSDKDYPPRDKYHRPDNYMGWGNHLSDADWKAGLECVAEESKEKTSKANKPT